MRCWRNALDEILDHHASKVLPSSSSRSETEKALTDSLRQLELQCKERIDLLQALRISRQDTGDVGSSSSHAGARTKSSDSSASLSSLADRGWIGQGTIPAVTYPELSRPALPKRPSLPNRTSTERATTSGNAVIANSESSALPLPSITRSSPAIPQRQEAALRSPSPDKHTMRTTLRSGKPAERASAKLTRKSTRPEGPGASKAATLAWSALSSKESLFRSMSSTADASASQATPRASFDSSTRVPLQWDTHTRRLVSPRDIQTASLDNSLPSRHSDEYPYGRPSTLSVNAASSALKASSADALGSEPITPKPHPQSRAKPPKSMPVVRTQRNTEAASSETDDAPDRRKSTSDTPLRRKAVVRGAGPAGRKTAPPGAEIERRIQSEKRWNRPAQADSGSESSASSSRGDTAPPPSARRPARDSKGKRKETVEVAAHQEITLDEDEGVGSEQDEKSHAEISWKKKKRAILKSLPSGVDDAAAKQILNEIVVKGDEVHWTDVAGLEIAKNALRETVVYPFLRPDLFMGLREPARGMLLFGPPGTGKTMLARAVATESRSTFFSISASSLTSKYLGESEKLVRALFALAKELAPSIIFVDEIDSLLSQRSGAGEHEATRRIKTEFLIQWSDLQRAAAGRAIDDKDRDRGDPNRVLVLAATNLPWAIDEAARRRFVRRQYIPLPEPETRSLQLRTLLGQQKHELSEVDIEELVLLTDGMLALSPTKHMHVELTNSPGFSGSDITALAKDAAMGPLRSLGEALLHMTMDDIRPIKLVDFQASLATIRPSVSKTGLKEYEDWAREFGERGG